MEISTENRIKDLEKRVSELTQCILQMQNNQIPIIEKIDDDHTKLPDIEEETINNTESINMLGDAIIEMSEIIYQ